MQKIEYTCDRCGTTKEPNRMYKFRVWAIWQRDEKKPEIQLERFVDDNTYELCDDCRASLNEWFRKTNA